MSDSTMREAFEAWVIGPTGTGRPWRCTEPGFVHQYEDSHTELAWRAWTASRKAALEEAAKVCEQVNREHGEHPEMALTCASAIRALKE